jgi:hypothetical protein
VERLTRLDVVGRRCFDAHAGDLADLAVRHHDAVRHLLLAVAAITMGAPGFLMRAIAFGSR